MPKNNKKVVVGMSGGVDSSVALMLLKHEGYDPIGVSLKYEVWNDPANKLKENVCCSEESFEIARHVCKKMGCEYHILDARKDFANKVVAYFKDELRNKRTPNPCVICNRVLKFSELLGFADKVGAQYVATGHFARIKNGKLLKAKDEQKDQTYTLSFLNREWLPRILLPLGKYTKDEIYEIAKEEGFGFYEKRAQSQDFCFVSSDAMKVFLEKEIGVEKGNIVDEKEEKVGEHNGLHFYTIGQRKGIDVPNGPHYVLGMNFAKNQLIITKDEESPSLYKSEMTLDPINFFVKKQEEPIKVEAKVRYLQKLTPATLYPGKNDSAKLIFDSPVRAVTLGQYAVFYQDEVCVGAGRICK